MILGWLGNALFGKREKKAVVMNISNKVLYKAATLVELYNAKHHEADWISLDDVAEASMDRFTAQALKINYEDDDLPTAPLPPVAQLHRPPEPSYKRQLRM